MLGRNFEEKISLDIDRYDNYCTSQNFKCGHIALE